ncbi:hypothetical protein SteCoe_8072 [Stentor coeruleus]|uniref:Uncharacterized protein n=1 Tax=Stentor coeruleus TaxID=5963 RepID=A0A1R2CL26_9CILI|nr:hypothetical protein SteCoe_8072 [Stentor coeruleus]
MLFNNVERLREKLKSDYPIFRKLDQKEGFRNSSVKLSKNYESPVRPTFSSDEVISMAKNSSKFVCIKDMEFPASPKNNRPIEIKTQHFEVVTGLDCFLKHISTKSYEKHIAENVPSFKKTIVKMVKFPEMKLKAERKSLGVGLNSDNLELLGQKEKRAENPSLGKKNLLKINRKINRNIKRWCINEAKKTDLDSQFIDYHTFKFKGNA